MGTILVTLGFSLLLIAIGFFYLKRSVLKSIQDQNKLIQDVLNSGFTQVSNNVGGQLGLLGTTLGTSVTSLSQQVNSVPDINLQLKKLTDLMVPSTKLRGNTGEALLGDLLHDFVPKELLKENMQLGGGTVEFAVQVSTDSLNGNGKFYVPVDAKLSLEPYQNYLSALSNPNDAATIKSAKAKFEAELKREAKDVSSKYLDQKNGDDQTVSFGIVYIPFESVYSVVKKDFWDTIYALHKDKNIIFAGPDNLALILSCIKLCNKLFYTHQNSAAAVEHIQNFSRTLSKLRETIDVAEKNFETGRKKIHDLKAAFGILAETIGSLTEGTKDQGDGLESIDIGPSV